MKNCDDFESLIDLYLDDELTREQKKLFEKHISSCNSCHEKLEFAKNIKQTLRAMPEIEIPEDFNQKLMYRIEKECKREKGFGFYARKYGALAACVVIAIAIGGKLSYVDFTDNGVEENNLIVEGTQVPETKNTNSNVTAGEETTPTKEKAIPAIKTPTKQEKKRHIEADEQKPNTAVTPVPTSEPNRDLPSDLYVDVPTKPSAQEPVTTENEYAVSRASAMVEDIAKTAEEIEAMPEIMEFPSTSAIETEEMASGGGGSARMVDKIVEPTVIIAVSEAHAAIAASLATEFATVQDGVYTTDKTSFENMIEAFDIGGITYTKSGAVDGDTVTFIIN